jgi:hypothetical protein
MNEKDLYTKIIKGQFILPNHFSSKVCELIKKMLRVVPNERVAAQEVISKHI